MITILNFDSSNVIAVQDTTYDGLRSVKLMKNTFKGGKVEELSLQQKSCYIREKLVENWTQTCREISSSLRKIYLRFSNLLSAPKKLFIFLTQTSGKKSQRLKASEMSFSLIS